MLSIATKFKGDFWKNAEKSPAIFEKEMKRGLNESLMHLQGKIVPRTPIDVGTARASITTAIRGVGLDIFGSIGSPLKYILPLEYGRRAGQKRPPMDVIKRWFQHKGLTPTDGKSISSAVYMIAKTIGKRGFKRPHKRGWRMFEQTFREEKDKVLSFMNSARDRIVQRLS